MLTDRCGTTVLLVVLSHLYRHAWAFFAFLLVLDIVSHWCQMFRYVYPGGDCICDYLQPYLSASKWPLCGIVFVLVSFGAHFFHFTNIFPAPDISYPFSYSKLASGKTSHKGSDNALLNFYYTFPYALFVICCGNELFIVFLYVLAFTEGTVVTVAGLSVGLVKLICYVNFPIFVLKNVLNVVQLYDAVKEIADADIKEARKTK